MREANKFIAVELGTWDYEYFDSRGDAEKWLKNLITEDGEISEDSEGSFVAEIVSVVKLPVVDRKENYPCHHGFECCESSLDCPEDCEGGSDGEWNHCTDADEIVDVLFKHSDGEKDARIAELEKENKRLCDSLLSARMKIAKFS